MHMANNSNIQHQQAKYFGISLGGGGGGGSMASARQPDFGASRKSAMTVHSNSLDQTAKTTTARSSLSADLMEDDTNPLFISAVRIFLDFVRDKQGIACPEKTCSLDELIRFLGDFQDEARTKKGERYSPSTIRVIRYSLNRVIALGRNQQEMRPYPTQSTGVRKKRKMEEMGRSESEQDLMAAGSGASGSGGGAMVNGHGGGMQPYRPRLPSGGIGGPANLVMRERCDTGGFFATSGGDHHSASSQQVKSGNVMWVEEEMIFLSITLRRKTHQTMFDGKFDWKTNRNSTRTNPIWKISPGRNSRAYFEMKQFYSEMLSVWHSRINEERNDGIFLDGGFSAFILHNSVRYTAVFRVRVVKTVRDNFLVISSLFPRGLEGFSRRRFSDDLLYCPAVFGRFSPAPVKTDRAVVICTDLWLWRFTMKVYAWLIDWFCTFPGKLPYGYNSRVNAKSDSE